jgi:hypothetical protein
MPRRDFLLALKLTSPRNCDTVSALAGNMSSLRVIFWVVFFAGVALCSSAKHKYLNCENGVYDTLHQVTEDCRRSSYAPYLRELRKKQNHVSGKDIADLLQNYCTVANQVAACVEANIDFLPCLSQELETYRKYNRRSDWFCHNNTAREAITDIFNELPMENLNYRTNACYRDVPLHAYPCIRRQLREHTDRKETIKRILLSMRCTFRKLYPKCSRNTALLLTTVEYDWLLIPPALGFNVSETIITLAKMKFG